MRLIPLVTAIAVSAGLYFLVLQREDLFAFARGEAAAEAAQTDTGTPAEEAEAAPAAEKRVDS